MITDLKIDCSKLLEDIENYLRNRIVFILKDIYGEDWEQSLGVTDARKDEWNKRKIEEEKRLGGKTLSNDILDYSDFYDLKTIIFKNWENIFKNLFINAKQTDYYFSTLESFRNPNAHRRELLKHQEHLLIGIIGELKMNIMKYKSKTDKMENIFPTIESVQINGEKINKADLWSFHPILKNGDILEIKLFVIIPFEQEVLFKYSLTGEWQEEKTFIINVTDDLRIGENSLFFLIKSNKDYHRRTLSEGNDYDDSIIIKIIKKP